MMHKNILLDRTPWAFLGKPDNMESLSLAVSQTSHGNNTEKPFFSLITPLWNTPPHFLEAAIQSCLLQTFSSWELILLDDGSSQTDHLPLAEKYEATDTRIRFYRNAKNAGISAARNEAISKTRGEYIAILDHDDLLHPLILSHYYELLKQNSLDLIYCNEVKIDSEGERLSDFFFKPQFDRQTLMRTNYIAHLAAVKASRVRELAKDGKYFDSNYDGVEDHHYFLGLSALENFRVLHSPVFGYYWRKSPTSTAESLDAKPYVKTKLCHMLEKHALIGSRVNWPELNKIPVWSYQTTASLNLNVIVWGPKDDLFAEELRRQTGVNLRNIKFSLEETLTPTLATRDERQPSTDGFLLIIHSSVRLSAEDALYQMTAFLNADRSYSSVSPKITDENGLDRGDFSLQWLQSSVSQMPILQSWTLESDFSSEQRLALLPSPFCSIIRGGDEKSTTRVSDLWSALVDDQTELRPFYQGNLTSTATIKDCIPEKLSIFALTRSPVQLAQLLTGRQMSYDSHMRWLHASPIQNDWLNVPFRYKVVDRINSRIKASLRPLHRILKLFMKKTAPKSSVRSG